ncbi:hypothetical protein COT64_01845 [Candidatus Shapirobacteria bacterium CG09_land_8_20_14_0_10_39_12]|uniref:Helix-turn-helix domain-containing protein n=1 Tax=Candidatus Shapirobacteria bacterium CG09_land_8_20_14_0_10_39_12 TaxID=1974885 RepID=A0A2H0WPS7_9BACT|nr:MAG: hypothetical protein COT64_01845 [Candidatus Shapirobacteria bacterium CG09_land_8_20_14_0_10_39_12]
MNEKMFYSVAEVALMLGISRIAVFKKIKAGVIRAIRIGRAYGIPHEELKIILGESLTGKQKKDIETGVKKAVKEYKETFRMLGNE